MMPFLSDIVCVIAPLFAPLRARFAFRWSLSVAEWPG